MRPKLETSESSRDERPWGYYRVIAEQENYKVKEIVVHPRHRLSLQRHQHRTEHWYIVKGIGVVTHDNHRLTLIAGDSINLPRMTWHRIMNTGEQDLVFVEIQTGDYFGEDDIERREDDYGRVGVAP